ncbi:MAG: segregation and condensation protein [Thermodesulfobacteriota bacterium]|nr:segregation and condensation protein [Thermodesulfobacteriota bacterium]
MVPIMEKPLELIIEALLFASSKPLSVQEIHRCLPDVPAPDIRAALTGLQTTYDAMERSFCLKEVAEGYQIRTRSAYAPYVLRMLRSSPSRLSRAALETLAIIAYKQPIIRQEIEQFRGVDAGGILRTLLEKDLIRIMGRKTIPGRPLIYGTTKKFLEVFDLKDLESLPKLKELKDFGSGDEAAVHLPEEDGQVERSKENETRSGPEEQGLPFPKDREGPTA